MNANFVTIIKRIIAEQGESILANPQQLKGYIADYAKNEPKEDRLAFGRCIEAGAYAQLKTTRTDAERRQVKAALLPRIRQTSGLGAAQCSAALDALEAALFGIPQSAPQPQYQSPPRYQHSQSSRQAYRPTVAARQMPATAPAQYQNQAYRQPSAPYGAAQTVTAWKKKRTGIFVLAAALLVAIIIVVGILSTQNAADGSNDNIAGLIIFTLVVLVIHSILTFCVYKMKGPYFACFYFFLAPVALIVLLLFCLARSDSGGYKPNSHHITVHHKYW